MRAESKVADLGDLLKTGQSVINARLWLVLASPLPVLGCMAPELDQARPVRVQLRLNFWMRFSIRKEGAARRRDSSSAATISSA
jgi:hypothetical protein